MDLEEAKQFVRQKRKITSATDPDSGSLFNLVLWAAPEGTDDDFGVIYVKGGTTGSCTLEEFIKKYNGDKLQFKPTKRKAKMSYRPKQVKPDPIPKIFAEYDQNPPKYPRKTIRTYHVINTIGVIAGILIAIFVDRKVGGGIAAIFLFFLFRPIPNIL